MSKNNRPYIEVIPQKCSGCRLCELVCSSKHNPGWVNSKKARIRVQIEHRENKNEPRVCGQCPEQPCLESCPTEAIRLHPGLGIPFIDLHACNGCRLCQQACPYEVIYFDEESKVALKCDLCDGDPQCVKNCPQGAILFGCPR